MCTHSIDDLLPHAPLHYAATGEMVKGSYIIIHCFRFLVYSGLTQAAMKIQVCSKFCAQKLTNYPQSTHVHVAST